RHSLARIAIACSIAAVLASALPLSGRAGALGAQRQRRRVRGETKGVRMHVYVGTYTQRGSKGIYQFDFDVASGRATAATAAAETPNPSYLAITPDHPFQVAVTA